MQICPRCGEENPDRFRVCGMCGAELAPEAPAQEVRKTVTIVFSDLKGSTSLGERLDSESLREILNHYFREMQAVLERHGGRVEKYIGDAIMAVFGLPMLHEDDAVRAVRAADEMKGTLDRVNEELEVTHGVRLENRTGVNTGEVVAGDVTTGQRLVTGDAVNVAARLEQNAPAMEVLLGETTYRLVKDAVEVEPVEPLELRGKSEPMPAYRLISVTKEEGVARRLDSPMVGRQRELSTLTQALDEATQTRTCKVVTVVAPAGVGKSRLLREFLDRSREGATELRGRCLSYGEGITFWPLAEVTRQAAGIENDDDLETAITKLDRLLGVDARDIQERIAAAIGLSASAFPVEETFWAARRLFELLARNRPLIILVEDIHWAEQTFLDLIRHIAEKTEGAGVILACSARPELLEEQPDWGRDDANMRTIRLESLSDEESSMVVTNLLGSTSLDERAQAKIIEAAQGNPLFVEQMLSMMIDDGILARGDDGAWVLVSDVGSLEIPPSINALLSARLDRLNATERAVVERGAVIGQVFFRGAVEELSAARIRPVVGETLSALSQKELIAPHESTFANQHAYRFLHILIRDATYNGILKRTRAELHERFVDWLELVASDRGREFEEIRGYHLEQAHLILSRLAPLDDHGKQLGKRGAAYLASAGRRALARGDMPAGASLLRRAAALLPEADPTRPRLLLQAGEALIEQGQFPLAEELLDAAIDEATSLGDRNVESTARLVRLRLEFTRDPETVEQDLTGEVERAIPQLEQLDDHYGLAKAWDLLQFVHWTAGRYGAAEAAAEHMIAHAQLADDPLSGLQSLGSLAICALYGPTPVPQAVERCHALLERATNDRKAQALILCALGQLEAMRGDFQRGRELCGRSRAMLKELGFALLAALTSLSSSEVERLAGDPVAAENELRRDYRTLEGMGDKLYIPTTAAMLAGALYEQGRLEEAERFCEISAKLTAPDDVASQSLWRCVRAKILARYGRFDEAEALAQEGAEFTRSSDDLESQANVLIDLAEIFLLAGKADEAVARAAEALELLERKGNIVSAQRARAFLKTLGEPTQPAERTGSPPPRLSP